MRQASREQQSAARIAERLRERQDEIERAMLTRVYAVSKPPPRGGPEYVEGLRAAVSAGVDYGLAGIERGEVSAPPIPAALLSQARLASRSGVSLDTVLRRYFGGHTLLEDFLIEEAEREELLEPAALKRLLRSQASIADRLLAAVSNAYAEEAQRRPDSSEQRRAKRIERLLCGEPLATADLAYDFAAWHLGMIASGPGAGEAAAAIARSLDRRLLSVCREEGTLWAWLGSKRRFEPGVLEDLASRELPFGLSLAIGEPAEGLAGWRLTHRQASAALSVARRSDEQVVRYSRVALVASSLRDELLATSLQQLYLMPLRGERDGGKALRETLRAFFAAERNISSTAASMEADRKTVTARLRAVERVLGRPIATCAAELETALRLEELIAAPTLNLGIDSPN